MGLIEPEVCAGLESAGGESGAAGTIVSVGEAMEMT